MVTTEAVSQGIHVDGRGRSEPSKKESGENHELLRPTAESKHSHTLLAWIQIHEEGTTHSWLNLVLNTKR